jgi:hypothetical protein
MRRGCGTKSTWRKKIAAAKDNIHDFEIFKKHILPAAVLKRNDAFFVLSQIFPLQFPESLFIMLAIGFQPLAQRR